MSAENIHQSMDRGGPRQVRARRGAARAGPGGQAVRRLLGADRRRPARACGGPSVSALHLKKAHGGHYNERLRQAVRQDALRRDAARSSVSNLLYCMEHLDDIMEMRAKCRSRRERIEVNHPNSDGRSTSSAYLDRNKDRASAKQRKNSIAECALLEEEDEIAKLTKANLSLVALVETLKRDEFVSFDLETTRAEGHRHRHRGQRQRAARPRPSATRWARPSRRRRRPRRQVSEPVGLTPWPPRSSCSTRLPGRLRSRWSSRRTRSSTSTRRQGFVMIAAARSTINLWSRARTRTRSRTTSSSGDVLREARDAGHSATGMPSRTGPAAWSSRQPGLAQVRSSERAAGHVPGGPLGRPEVSRRGVGREGLAGRHHRQGLRRACGSPTRPIGATVVNT